MEIFCSFHEISGGECGHSSKDQARSVAHVPLLTCERNIQPHKAAFKFSGVDSEVDLILARVSLFSRPKNVWLSGVRSKLVNQLSKVSRW